MFHPWSRKLMTLNNASHYAAMETTSRLRKNMSFDDPCIAGSSIVLQEFENGALKPVREYRGVQSRLSMNEVRHG